MDTVKEELEAFKGAIQSMRWFMTTAVLISTLILLHVWLEKFSFQKEQLVNNFARRAAAFVPESLACYRALAVELSWTGGVKPPAWPPACASGKFPDPQRNQVFEHASKGLEHFLDEYAIREYRFQLANHTMEKEALQVRKIPLLGVEVPANDFVTVMAVMSLVFATGVWLNLRTISGALSALAKRMNPELLATTRLHTSFLSSLETAQSERLARGARYLAIWLPFGSLFIATVLGYMDAVVAAVGTSPFNFGKQGTLIIHLIAALVLIVLHFCIAFAAQRTIKVIDETFHAGAGSAATGGPAGPD